MGRYATLRGVVLELNLPASPLWMLLKKNVMRHVFWKTRKIPAIIRAFQQHKLEAAHTSFLLRRHYYYPMLTKRCSYLPQDEHLVTEGLAGLLKGQLLDHHPRRLSRRGLEDKRIGV